MMFMISHHLSYLNFPLNTIIRRN